MRADTGIRAVQTATRSLLLTAAAMALVLVAAACGSSSKSSTTATTASPASTGSTASGGSSAPALVATGASSKLGAILVDSKGLTVYTFDPENAGGIKCTGSCSQTWHAVAVPSGVTTPSGGPGVTLALGTITRPDGTTQVTGGGHPLYTYIGDQAPGDTNGDGIGGIWHVARPAAAGATSSTAPGATTATTAYKY